MELKDCSRCFFSMEFQGEQKCVARPPVFVGAVPRQKPGAIAVPVGPARGNRQQLKLEVDIQYNWDFPPAVQRCGEYKETVE